jgi:uncharacterized protein YdhG (YjbR/CyaY superfamily)
MKDIMRKSKFGKETAFLWEGTRKPEEISWSVAPGTLQISDELQQKIKSEWEKIAAKNPNAFDAPKWRAESVYDNGHILNIEVSPIHYSQHNVMRHVQGKDMAFYPNPITINTVQETPDGYVLIGVKGKGSDQKGLGLVGAGFVERYVENGISRNPEMIGYVVQKECMEETSYKRKLSFNMEDALALAVIFGSNHDTTVGFYLPIFATSKEVGVRENEHDDLILLPNKQADISAFLDEGGYKGIKASDHLLGCIEAYWSFKSQRE